MESARRMKDKATSTDNHTENNPKPANDQQRVAALKRYHIIGSAPEKSFDNIANLAANFFDLPVALINFVDTEEVFVKTSMDIKGANVATPRSSSLCSLAMLSNEVTVFETLPIADPCLLSNSILAAEIGFKFYAGAPLITYDGFSIGTICVMGYEKRNFSEKEKQMLANMAKIVMDQIEMRLHSLFEFEQGLIETADQIQKNRSHQSIISAAPIAIGLFTGKEMTIEIANIKILELWGKTEEVIGKTLKEALPEIQGQGFLEILDQVYRSGNPFFGNEQYVMLERHNRFEEVCFNFVYQPVKNGGGQTSSIMVIATEVTEHVNTKKRLQFISMANVEMLAAHLDIAQHHQNLKDTLHQLPQNNPEVYSTITEIGNNLKKVEEALRLITETAKT